MLERTLVLVDTSYLLASFYNSWEEGARGQLEISLAAVVHRLDQVARGLVDQPVQRQNWYDGIPESGPHRYQRTLRVIEGVQLRAGQLIEWGDRRTQKAVDTLLVADMIQAAHRGHCSDMVLVTGDADMIPGVHVAVDAGVRMHLVGFGWDSISSALRHACDTTTVLDPRSDFQDAMQIRVLEGPIPPKVRSAPPTPTHPGQEALDPEADETVSLVEAELRSDRAAAASVADEARQTIADEERAAAAEELAADVEEGATLQEAGNDGYPVEPRPGPAGDTTGGGDAAGGGETAAGGDASGGGDTRTGRAQPTPLDAAPKPGPTPRPTSRPSPAHAAQTAQTPQSPQPPQSSQEGPQSPQPPQAPPSRSAQPSESAEPAQAPGAPPATSTPESRSGRGKPTPATPATPPTPTTPATQAARRTSPGGDPNGSSPRPNPSMMAPHRRPLRSKFVPLPEEVWTSSGEQTPFDVGQQYAAWWYDSAATEEQRDQAHLLSGGVLPPAIDRPLLQFACQMLNEFTLTEHQRVHLRDGFHEGIRAVLLKNR